MREVLYLVFIIGVLVALIVVSGGLLVWLSPVTEGQLTPAQDTLINAADWMIKACTGGILGFAAGRTLANGKASRNPSS